MIIIFQRGRQQTQHSLQRKRELANFSSSTNIIYGLKQGDASSPPLLNCFGTRLYKGPRKHGTHQLCVSKTIFIVRKQKYQK
jgi:hypothetical protein